MGREGGKVELEVRSEESEMERFAAAAESRLIEESRDRVVGLTIES